MRKLICWSDYTYKSFLSKEGINNWTKLIDFKDPSLSPINPLHRQKIAQILLVLLFII